MTPESVAEAVAQFLGEAREAVVLEDGAVVFDLGTAKYSISVQHDKCLLHLWSEERNAVRRVLNAKLKNGGLRLEVQRLGQARPGKMEICRGRDRLRSTAKKLARAAYQRLLRRVLEREFPGCVLERVTSAMDLERSFGPVYTRALLRHGQSCFAVLGVNAQETQASVDAALTAGILWLDLCREGEAGPSRAQGRSRRTPPRTRYVEGLKLFVPAGASAVVRERMAHLNQAAAKWQLYELDEQGGGLQEIEAVDRGNVQTRLVHCPDSQLARQRFAASIARVLAIAPDAEVVVLSAGEIAFRRYGLEFARARIKPQPGTFRSQEEIVFGAGAAETLLCDDTAALFELFVRQLMAQRAPQADRNQALWRMSPERWLEALVLRDLGTLDARLDPQFVYSQVPAFAASDRAMIDVLTLTRERRLAVLELKAEEDLHLPLQGIDYWARVEWHRQRGEFQRFGYFSGLELSPKPPLLLLVAPALRVHPTLDRVLHYLSPDIEVELIGIDERWRDELRVVFRKRQSTGIAAAHT